jgi:hypothetical protein
MSDDYLTDKKGRDPEVEGLEALLRPLAWRPAPLPVLQRDTSPAPAPAPGAAPASRRAPRILPFALFLAAAAAVALVALPGMLRWVRPAPPPAPDVPGAEAGLAYSCASPEGVRECRPGAEIVAAGAPVTLSLAGIGTLVAEAESRLRVLAIGDDLHKLRLERGTVRASIRADARPRLFQVETPATTCIDLGCVYTLSVDEEGASLVRVTLGRVAFADGDREVYVPSGASCRARKDRGSGTPVFEDAPESVARAVRAFDDAPSGGRLAAARALAESCERKEDTLSLYHLLGDPDREVAAAALDGLERIELPPEGAPRAAVLAGDPAAVAAWRARLERWWW